MREIIDRLSEIEEAAQKIMDDTNLQKKEISDRMKEKTRQFDMEIDEETKRALNAASVKLKAQVEEELNNMRTETEKIKANMLKTYEDMHTSLAQGVLQKIVEA